MKKITKLEIQKKYDFLHMPFGIECGPGWFIILDKLFLSIQKEIEKNNISDFRITQVKEKFGELRIYYNHVNKNIDNLINKASRESLSTCELCGKKGKIRTIGWLTTLCDKCYKDAMEAK